jgi:hypothetical protein
MQKAALLKILRGKNTVFTFKDILLASGETNAALLRRRINYYVQAKEIYPIRRGIYAKDRNYDRLELANKIFSPSYISFETVLAKAGVIFQHYDRFFAASYLTREITCDGGVYSFRRLKSTVLANSKGIEIKPHYSIASKERAFLDVLYLFPEYHFDNLSPIDWKRCREILPIYRNKALAKRFVSYTALAQNA